MYLRTLKIRPNKVYGAKTFYMKKPLGVKQFWSQDLLDQLKFFRYADKEGDFSMTGNKRFGTGESLMSHVSPLDTPKVGRSPWQSNLMVKTIASGQIGAGSILKSQVRGLQRTSGRN